MCRALPRVLTLPPSILGLLPPPSLLRMLVSLALGSVFPVLSLIISPGGDVSIFMEAAASLLWRSVVFLLLATSDGDEGILHLVGRDFRLDSYYCDEFDT
ncbi:Hypothetical predicted protein [Prunus dulcis]|uniref:Uncharacterized protein n=1 Tax=Prunus dulcis TaxID=3755 RepID=A0A5E4FA78_PRUDU|nr:Hypothetical predicted protein [Prunus dulcis]